MTTTQTRRTACSLDGFAEKLTQAKARQGTLSVLYHKGNGSFAGLKIMGDRHRL